MPKSPWLASADDELPRRARLAQRPPRSFWAIWPICRCPVQSRAKRSQPQVDRLTKTITRLSPSCSRAWASVRMTCGGGINNVVVMRVQKYRFSGQRSSPSWHGWQKFKTPCLELDPTSRSHLVSTSRKFVPVQARRRKHSPICAWSLFSPQSLDCSRFEISTLTVLGPKVWQPVAS